MKPRYIKACEQRTIRSVHVPLEWAQFNLTYSLISDPHGGQLPQGGDHHMARRGCWSTQKERPLHPVTMTAVGKKVTVAMFHLSDRPGVPARRCLRWARQCCPHTSRSQWRASTEWTCTGPARHTEACGRPVCVARQLPPPGIWSWQELSRNTGDAIKSHRTRTGIIAQRSSKMLNMMDNTLGK